MPAEASTDYLTKEPGIIVALDAIQDPGNLGTIIRSATWFGCRGLLVGKGTVDPFHPKVARSTAGTTGVLPYQMGNLADLMGEFANGDWQILALESSEGARSLGDVDHTMPTVVVAGNEAQGIQPNVRKLAKESIKVSAGRRGDEYLDSLNVAITVGISLYELTKD
jgi:TrmH family RNA methyltransferase